MIAINVKNVSKNFIVVKEQRSTLKEKLIFRKKSHKEEYCALLNVDCQIEKGKTIGLIGKNGSGKSTLLKLMTKIIYPTSGVIEVNGRVSSLLELGAGFHPDFTGRENIYMNASILGFNKKEIDNKLDTIIAFSELEDFIDNPLRSYSSGMYMRLAFSVAISVDPDILLIDEILSVGDNSFQKKCFNRLKELKNSNKTIIIVSHDHQTLERICDEVIWINNGEVFQRGESKQVINEYLDFLANEEGTKLQKQVQHKENDVVIPIEHVDTENIINRWGNGKIKMNKVEIIDRKGAERFLFTSG
jgi:ABC-type polysaccharide/polyol phosphate transport system ATPase subunit